MLEREFQSKLRKAGKSRGAKVINIHGHSMQEAGLPDLYWAHRLFHGWTELKTGKSKPTKLQRIQMRRLLERGVPAFWLTVEARHPDGWMAARDAETDEQLGDDICYLKGNPTLMHSLSDRGRQALSSFGSEAQDGV